MAHIRWDKGGDASVVIAEDDLVTVDSSIPSAPGSRIEGSIASGAKVRVKVARCKRLPAQDPSPLYRIEGRLLDASRALRSELGALARANPAKEPPGDPAP